MIKQTKIRRSGIIQKAMIIILAKGIYVSKPKPFTIVRIDKQQVEVARRFSEERHCSIGKS